MEGVFLFSCILLVLAPVIFGCTLEGFVCFCSSHTCPLPLSLKQRGLRGCNISDWVLSDADGTHPF